MSFTVMVGNPMDGYELHGVFDDEETADEWASSADFKEAWWVTPIKSVDDLDDQWLNDDDDDLPELPPTPIISTRSH